jgi:hypothetical protein
MKGNNSIFNRKYLERLICWSNTRKPGCISDEDSFFTKACSKENQAFKKLRAWTHLISDLFDENVNDRPQILKIFLDEKEYFDRWKWSHRWEEKSRFRSFSMQIKYSHFSEKRREETVALQVTMNIWLLSICLSIKVLEAQENSQVKLHLIAFHVTVSLSRNSRKSQHFLYHFLQCQWL